MINTYTSNNSNRDSKYDNTTYNNNAAADTYNDDNSKKDNSPASSLGRAAPASALPSNVACY